MNGNILNICVHTSNYPSVLQIVDCNGIVICKKNMTRHCEKIRLKTCNQKLFFVMKYQNQTITKPINLQNCLCQNILVTFNFVRNLETLQRFFLVDFNYGFPVKFANLNFISKK